MLGFKEMLAAANAVIDVVSVSESLSLIGDPGTVFVDVRESLEREREGTIVNSVHAPRGFLEFIADPQGPMHNEVFASGKRLVLFCGTGGRSALAAKTLLDMGFYNVASLAGGFKAWKEAGGSTET